MLVVVLLVLPDARAVPDRPTRRHLDDFAAQPLNPHHAKSRAAAHAVRAAADGEGLAASKSDVGGAASSVSAPAPVVDSSPTSHSSSLSSGSDIVSSASPPPLPTTPQPTPSPPRGRARAAAHLSLLGLLALLVLVVIGGVVAWCVYRRNRNRRRVRSLRLNGTRRPGEVDDADMGQAVKGGDWLHLDSAEGATHVVGAARRSRFTTSLDALQTSDAVFDPIGQQAAEARKRKRARRVAVAAAERAGGGGEGKTAGGGAGSGVFHGGMAGNEPGADESEMWSSEEGDSDTGGGGTGGGGVGNAAVRGPIYASSMAPAGGAARMDGAALSFGGSGGGAPSTSVVPPLTLSPQYFNQTAKVLMDRYNTEGDGGGGGGGPQGGSAVASSSSAAAAAVPSTVAAGGRGGSLANHGATENNAFEHILASAVAPLRVGEEFHQRGGSLLPPDAASARKGESAATKPAGQTGANSDEEDEEDEEDESEDLRGGHAPNVRRGEASAFDDANDEEFEEEEDEEYEEEEEDDVPPTRGHGSPPTQRQAGVAPPFNGGANRSLR